MDGNPNREETEFQPLSTSDFDIILAANEQFYRGNSKGAGQALLEFSEEYLRRSGAREIELFVLDNNHSARKFYKKMGYTLTRLFTRDFTRNPVNAYKLIERIYETTIDREKFGGFEDLYKNLVEQQRIREARKEDRRKIPTSWQITNI